MKTSRYQPSGRPSPDGEVTAGLNTVPSAPLKPSEVLERAAALIEPEGAWTQFARARADQLFIVEPTSADATCWCIVGAVQRVDQDRVYDPYAHPALRPLREVLRRDVGGWNDEPNRTQAEVVAALRQAAELARSEGR